MLRTQMMFTRGTHGVRAGARGAVLVHVAAGLLALMALSALVIDYGVLWVSRGQAQNAADAAALSAAISLAFHDSTSQSLAQNGALAVAQRHVVWGATPGAQHVDVTFPACPTPAIPSGTSTPLCVRVDVHRTHERGNALPVFFAGLVGVPYQGVRATATAEVLIGDSSNCAFPLMLADKWIENHPVPGQPWGNPTDQYDRYAPPPPPTPDVYAPPSPSSAGTSFTVSGDYGRAITLIHEEPFFAAQPGSIFPVVLNPQEPPGQSSFQGNITSCDGTVIGPGKVLAHQPGAAVAQWAGQSVSSLVQADPSASWDPSANGGRGAPAGGCMAAGTCARSPRLVALPLFDTDAYDQARLKGQMFLRVTNIVGFWIESVDYPGSSSMNGYFTHYPTVASTAAPNVGFDSAFMRTVALVR